MMGTEPLAGNQGGQSEAGFPPHTLCDFHQGALEKVKLNQDSIMQSFAL